jgi:glycosyltransferase involved in cell wall biosynthesis
LRFLMRKVAVRRPTQRVTERAAAVCLVQNRSTAQRLHNPRIMVLPNALTVRLPELGPPEPRGSDIVFVGRLVRWKGGHLAVRALRHVQHPDAVLRVFGTGPDRKRMERAAQRWGVADRLEWIGSVPRDELMTRLRRAGVLLHPALHEEAGLGVAEALGLGVPVVCLDHGGPADVARWWPDGSAALVRPSTPEDTARRLATAVDAALDRSPETPRAPIPAVPSFESVLLDVYDEVAGAGERGDRSGLSLEITSRGRSFPTAGTRGPS